MILRLSFFASMSSGLFSLMADENNSLRSEESLDGVHLTPKAYQRFVKELEKLF